MLRPIKSILNYFQLNTSTSTNDMADENGSSIEAAATTVTEDIVPKSIETEKIADGTDDDVSTSQTPKTPHDQNENELILITETTTVKDDHTKNLECIKSEKFSHEAACLVDLTSEQSENDNVAATKDNFVQNEKECEAAILTDAAKESNDSLTPTINSNSCDDEIDVSQESTKNDLKDNIKDENQISDLPVVSVAIIDDTINDGDENDVAIVAEKAANEENVVRIIISDTEDNDESNGSLTPAVNVICDKIDALTKSGHEDSNNKDENQTSERVESLESVAIVDDTMNDVFIVNDEEENHAPIIISDTENIDEEAKSELLDLSLESNEVIILEETDHNDSITDPLNDPLAIDDYNADVSNNMMTTCGSAGHSDTSIEGEVLFSVDSRTNVLCAPTSKASGRHSMRNKRDSYVVATVRNDINIEEQEVRSDGSDSGLGSETSTLQSNNSSMVTDSPLTKQQVPGKSNLKRRLDNSSEPIVTKKAKNAIHFNGVKVYYFPRVQGFGCVPSQGGCTLGMAAHHVQTRSFTLAEHNAEQRRVHKQQMQETNPRTSSSDETDSEEELSEASGSDLDADASGFLQPVPPKQRRAILKAAGIRKIDPSEKDECRSIRGSREFCGCNCRGYCDPDTCSCSQAGIKCQVDRPNFPCGCTRDGCANVVGRVEFNPSRVRTHYIHTIMRLDLEHKQKRALQIDTTVASSAMLSYGTNTVVTSTMNSLCSYNNLVNTSHMRHHQPMFNPLGNDAEADMHQNNQSNFMNGVNNTYPNRVGGDSILSPTTNMMNVDGSTMLRQRLIDHACNVATSSSHNIGDSLNMGLQTAANHSHDLDLHYAFRNDASATTVDLTTPTDTTSILGLVDYAPTSSLYHEVYSGGHSFLGQNYSNPSFCQPQNINYQQSFISYAAPTNPSVEISDITNDSEMVVNTATDTNIADPSYISLNSPVGNQCRVDAINELLHNTRSSAATSCTVIDPITTVSYNMPPSAQTSTSITEGTLTTVTPPMATQANTTFTQIDSKTDVIVDLTERIIPETVVKIEQSEQDDCKNDIIEIIETANESKIDVATVVQDCVVVDMKPDTKASNDISDVKDLKLDSKADRDVKSATTSIALSNNLILDDKNIVEIAKA